LKPNNLGVDLVQPDWTSVKVVAALAIQCIYSIEYPKKRAGDQTRGIVEDKPLLVSLAVSPFVGISVVFRVNMSLSTWQA